MFKGSSECIEYWLTSLSLSFLSLGALSEIHGIIEIMPPLWEERFLESDKAARAPLSFDGRLGVWWSFTWPGGSHRPCLMTSTRASGVTVCRYDRPQGLPCTSFHSRRRTQQEQGWSLLLATSHHPLSSSSPRTRLLHHAEGGTVGGGHLPPTQDVASHPLFYTGGCLDSGRLWPCQPWLPWLNSDGARDLCNSWI